jgi:hypothetical protein
MGSAAESFFYVIAEFWSASIAIGYAQVLSARIE